jgi:cysteinyl-tRNA synthetase
LRQSKARLENWKTFAAERRQNKKDFPFEREALSALEDDLNTPAAFAIIDQVVHKELPSDKDRYTVYTLLKRLGFSGPESSVLKIADSLSASLLKMRNLSLHDWDLIASNVRENPLLRSGNPKSATTLVAAMLAMKDIVTLIAPHLENADSSSEVRILVKSLLDDARPKPDTLSEMVSAAIAARNAARKAKNFKESDRIRDELLAKGIVLKDGPDGTTWEVKR